VGQGSQRKKQRRRRNNFSPALSMEARGLLKFKEETIASISNEVGSLAHKLYLYILPALRRGFSIPLQETAGSSPQSFISNLKLGIMRCSEWRPIRWIAYVGIVPKNAEGNCRQTVDDCPVTAIIIE